MENISRRQFIVDSVKLAGGVIGASALGTGFLYPQITFAKEEFAESTFENMTETGKRILVVYDSDYGYTAGVAVAVGKTLYEAGNSVDVRSVRNVNNLEDYDAVIIGSPIQYDKWMPDAVEFVEKHKNVLCKIPIAYFFTCLVLSRRTDKSAEKAMEYSNKIYSVVPAVEPVSIGQFGGLLDYSKISFFKKLILASVLSLKKVKEGDYRNWDEIDNWARGLELFRPDR